MHFSSDSINQLNDVFNIQKLIDAGKERRHILIGILGFRTGGGEIFPIHLANELVRRGHLVSVLILDTNDENPEVRNLLSSRIPVFERGLIQEIGLSHFLETNGIDLVHTHFLGVDLWIHQTCRELDIPYMVTHHGSYEVGELRPDLIESLLSAVDHWVYLADKNLEPFRNSPLDPAKLTKLPNAVPPDDGDFALTREALGIENEAFVFGLASRAFKAKGWEIAAEALQIVRCETDRPVYVIFCGDGEDFDELLLRFGERDGVKFLGYQDNIPSFYKLCDCCLLPTRFSGESFPLTLIESLQAGTPIIATDIGEIRNIIIRGKCTAGILLPNITDDKTFTARVADAMRVMLDKDVRSHFNSAVKQLDKYYSFKSLTSKYETIYENIIRQRN